MGRWVWQEFGQNDRILRICTVYRVNDGSVYASGECTAWAQQHRHLQKLNNMTNPRKQVMLDLKKELNDAIRRGFNVMVAGDFNEGLLSPEGMQQMFDELGLYNVFANRLDTTELPRTHARGSKVVDHVGVSKYVLDNITHAGIAPFGYLYESDHRGMFIDIDDTMLFHPEDSKLVYHHFWCLKTTIPTRIKKYMRHVNKCRGDQNIHDAYKTLFELCANSAPVIDIQLQLSHLDNLITEILIAAERQCTKLVSHHTDVWTPELMASLKNRRYWRTQLTKAQKLPNKIGLIAS